MTKSRKFPQPPPSRHQWPDASQSTSTNDPVPKISAVLIQKDLLVIGDPTKNHIRIDPDSGLSIRNDQTPHIELQTDGDLFVGINTSTPSGTYLALFSNPQTYNTETMLGGEMLLGDNTTGQPNILWNKTNGRLLFRNGQLSEASIDSHGRLIATNAIITGDGSGLTNIDGGNIQTNTITADALDVDQLSAITADMGELTAGTITGATIRTAANGARVELNSTKIFGTDGTTEQWKADALDGKLYAGGGIVTISSDGININPGQLTPNRLTWDNIAGAVAYTFNAVNYAQLYASNSAGEAQMKISASSGIDESTAALTLVEHQWSKHYAEFSCDLHMTNRINFYYGANQIGDIGVNDATWLRLNQNTAKNIYTPRLIRADGGITSGQLKKRQNGEEYDTFAYVPLQTPLTHSSWNGDAKSDVSTSTALNLTTFGLPSNVVAVNVRLVARDSAALGTNNLWVSLGPSATYYWQLSVRPVGNNIYAEANGVINTNGNSQIYYRINASGTNTMDVWLEIFGYWI